MICPLCRVPLASALIDDEKIALCDHCQGFLAHTETFLVIVTKRRGLQGLHENRTDPFDPAELKRVITCPNCQQPMDAHPYFGGGNAIVDTCQSCNLIWLDRLDLPIIESYKPYVHQIEPPLPIYRVIR